MVRNALDLEFKMGQKKKGQPKLPFQTPKNQMKTKYFKGNPFSLFHQP